MTIVAIRGADTASVAAAQELIDASLAAAEPRRGDRGSAEPLDGYRTMRGAVKAADANLAVISTPGHSVAAEAADAIRAGANVMIFSDGVPLAHERRLKELADGRGLLVMGPDCGTALIAGVRFGFVNELTRGAVAVVAASGTGAQQLTCLLDASGVGVSHVIGVGGRDLCHEVGGISTARALAVLDADSAVAHIVVVAKQAAAGTGERIRTLAAGLRTPTTVDLGSAEDGTLTDLAALVAAAVGSPAPELFRLVHERTVAAAPVAGLFSGGTLAREAASVLSARGHRVDGSEAFEGPSTLRALASAETSFVIDLGEDRFTAGRPHPMIDPGIRRAAIDALASRQGGRHLLIDVVLGHGAHPDPAGALAPSIEVFLCADAGRTASAAVIGTRRDPQDLHCQRQRLIAAGCDVYESNAQAAAEMAARLPADCSHQDPARP